MFARDCRRRNEELYIKLSYTPASEPETYVLNNMKMHVSQPHQQPCKTNKSFKDKKFQLHESQMRTGNQAESVTDQSMDRRTGRKRTSTGKANSGIDSGATQKAKQQHIGKAFVGSGLECRQFSSSNYTDNDEEDKRTEMSNLFQNILEKVMNIPTSEESKHISAYLNACGRSLAVVWLNQDSIRILKRDFLAEGLSIPGSDGDFTMFAYNYKVLETFEEEYDENYPGIQFLRLPDEGQPGYSKLHFIVHGPAFNCAFSYERIECFLQKARIGKQIYNTEKESSDVDIVFCIKGTTWPAEAAEWVTRRRSSDWPPEELFDRIINAGYFLAAVGSKESQDSKLQWRVSFNKAEQLIIESLNETQIHCIFLLKFLKNIYISDIAGKNITSYTMKTVMFWCLEEKSDAFWQSPNLVCCFCFCVSKLKYFLEKGFLPNYFIRKRNQFVASEFPSDIQTKTRQCLQRFLEDPKTSINLLLPHYRNVANTPISLMNICSQEAFIEKWLIVRVTRVIQFHNVRLSYFANLYNGYNIHNIFIKCNVALEKLSTVRYTQPLIKNLQNYMGVLQYILMKENIETGEHKSDLNSRKKYSKYMKLSAAGDLTHTNLRIATCYLDDGVKEDCLDKIRTVTDSDDNFFMQEFSERLKQTLHRDIDAFRKTDHTAPEIDLYKRIIFDIDFIDHDPYRTTDEFEQMKDRGHALIGSDAFILAWKRCYFDVTFMLAELPILPKPAALELCIDNSKKSVSFHPFVYGLLLEFLWHEKNDSTNRERTLILEKMTNCVSMIPDDQKSKALNFITYCYSLHNDHCSASRYLIRSFKLNPVTQNVAYLYIQYITKLLLTLSLDS
ncbi:unnamed protein product [Mytilus coruscus]|uniref:Uncharacterized protein n=1 Tax=Mytilus coruscus TaxID=42192 RepID=A0A6J8AAC3_MYTCO|nr:unnamed protein product [Mytilus coruscus]